MHEPSDEDLAAPDHAAPATATDTYRLAYLRVALTKGVGPLLLARLLDHFESPEAVLAASPNELTAIEGVGVEISRQLRSGESLARAEQVMRECEQGAIRILLPHDHEFPRLLREIQSPPSMLFVRGELRPTDSLAIAIVGTRGVTRYGNSQAARFAAALARAGLTIVSGLARGADAAAHRGALEAGGRTLGILSNGVAEVYPPQHHELGEQIVQQGALISEMPPGTKPKQGMFPHRNRLISGLTLGTLVVEAGERSGALITARLAGEQGREVFAIPGQVSSPQARGCHQLIRDGAHLAQDPEDIVDELGPLVEGIKLSPEQTVRRPAELQLNEQENAVLQAIGVEPTDINQVVVTSRLPVPRVLSTLSVLEMRRLVRRVSGQLVQRL